MLLHGYGRDPSSRAWRYGGVPESRRLRTCFTIDFRSRALPRAQAHDARPLRDRATRRRRSTGCAREPGARGPPGRGCSASRWVERWACCSRRGELRRSRAVVADCAFAQRPAGARGRRASAGPACRGAGRAPPCCRSLAHTLTGCDPHSVDVAAAAPALADRPVFIIHGENDNRFSPEQARGLWRRGSKDGSAVDHSRRRSQRGAGRRIATSTRSACGHFFRRHLLLRRPVAGLPYSERCEPMTVAARGSVGTQGWSYPDWVGTFYPPGSKQEHYLPVLRRGVRHRSSWTPPSTTRRGRASCARGRATRPRASASRPRCRRRITHTARLSSMGEQMQAFAAALEPLGERLGRCWCRCRPSSSATPGTVGVLDRFLAAAPRGVPARGRVPRIARGTGAETYDLLRARRRGAGLDRVARPAARDAR